MNGYLVVGATGPLGGEICRRLRERGLEVRGLVRDSSDPARIEYLVGLGVELFRGNLRDPASLDRACRGAEVVISTVTTIRSRQANDSFADTDEQGHANLISAAVASGAKRFVFISFSGNLGGADGMTRSKRATEQRLRESGLAYTILRPSLFMEVWLGPPAGFDYAARTATVFGAGDQPVSWISAGDVAEFAVLASLSTGPSETIELGGPEAMSRLDAIRLFEEESGAKFELRHVPIDALETQEKTAENEIARTYASLQLSCARGDCIDMSDPLGRYPVRLTSVREYARRVLGERAD